MTQSELVTVGLPVRNGAQTLPLALESLLTQSHERLDIVVCDNASEDRTVEICERFMRADSRIRLVRQPRPVTVTQNWRTAYEQARAPFFMWASDDDLHSPDYVATLLSALHDEPGAGLAFGTLTKFRDYATYDDASPTGYACATRGISTWRRLWMDKAGGFSSYGLFRTNVLRDYGWYEHTVSPDWPMLVYVLLRTEIVQVPGAVLYYREGEQATSAAARAKRQSYSKVERFPTARLSWRCGLAARDALPDRQGRVALDAAVVYAGLRWQNRHASIRRLLALPP
jgi:glycosyltransferase involved in cell wall biosynthesis